MSDPVLDLMTDKCSRMLSVLADPQRLRIIECLSDGSRNVGELAVCLGKHLVKVSHHLSVLKKAGLVKSNRRGRYIYYELQSGAISSSDILNGQAYLDLGCCRLELSKVSKKCCS